MHELMHGALLALTGIPGLGARRIRRLVDHFGSPADVFRADPGDLCRVGGLSEEIAESIKRYPDPAKVEYQLARIEKASVQLISLWDTEYPESLRMIHVPPVLLYVRGELQVERRSSIAIVGTRRPTRYGRETAVSLAGALAGCGFTVISGLARGVDSAAHRGALQGGGKTVAVLGSGIDIVYPPENRPLYDRIIDQGAVISEFAMGMEPAPGSFPQRNRIISGLAGGTVVVEAGQRSGALITANYALDQGREVFAVPGPVNNPMSRGPNRLIKEGAKLIEVAEDILEEFPAVNRRETVIETGANRLSPQEKQIWDLLSDKPLHIDMITAAMDIPSSEAMARLLSMELKNMIKHHSGMRYTR